MLVYLDTNIVIYVVQRSESFREAAAARLRKFSEDRALFAASHLVRMECRVGPLAQQDEGALAGFDRFFARPDVRMLELTAATFDRAAVIRAKHGFHVVDALHLAAALEGGCDAFFTNDARLAAFPDLRIISLT